MCPPVPLWGIKKCGEAASKPFFSLSYVIFYPPRRGHRGGGL